MVINIGVGSDDPEATTKKRNFCICTIVLILLTLDISDVVSEVITVKSSVKIHLQSVVVGLDRLRLVSAKSFEFSRAVLNSQMMVPATA